MSPEKQRIAIAKACGWKDCDINWLRKPALLLGSKPTFSNGKIISYLVDQTIPNYLNDLNACHEMEKVLTDEQTSAYITTLCLEVQPEPMLHHATAAEKCEAFLRTLGLWEEGAQ